MLTIIGWLWRDPKCRTQYTLDDANRWARMLHRNLTIQHRFILLTDRPEEKYDPLIEPVKLWDDWRDVRCEEWPEEFPQCYVRLKAFSSEMKRILGSRFISIDLDCIVKRNLDRIFSRREDFVICKRAPLKDGSEFDPYQACMFMMDAGARENVWSSFHGEESLRKLDGHEHEKVYKKTDQGWMARTLRKNEAVFSMDDGVYDWRWLEHKMIPPPKNARIVFFSGRMKPENYLWIAEALR